MNAHDENDPGCARQSKYGLAATKGRETKRARAEAKAADYRRRVFVAMHGDTILEQFGPVYELAWGAPQQYEPTGHFEIDDVIADIERRYHLPTMGDPDAREDREAGFGALD